MTLASIIRQYRPHHPAHYQHLPPELVRLLQLMMNPTWCHPDHSESVVYWGSFWVLYILWV